MSIIDGLKRCPLFKFKGPVGHRVEMQPWNYDHCDSEFSLDGVTWYVSMLATWHGSYREREGLGFFNK